jgi:sulfur-oxidizing protein SoxY
MPISRRAFVQASLTSAVLGGVAAQTAKAAFSKQVLEASSMNTAISVALGGDSFIDSTSVAVTAPDQAETGDVVPISIVAHLASIESISLIADKNPVPMVASFRLAPEVDGFVATRIKLAGSCNVVALIKSNGRLYRASKAVNVVIGGCGSDAEGV